MKHVCLALVLSFLVAGFACGPASESGSSLPPGQDAGRFDTDGAQPADAGNDAPRDADAPTTPVTGTVGGHAFTAAYGIAFPNVVGSAPGYEVVLSDKPIDCAKATLASSTMINFGAAGQPPAARTYTVIQAYAVTPGPGEA